MPVTSWTHLGPFALVLLQLPLAHGQSQSAPGAAVQESGSCALCHSNADRASAMRDADGRAIAPHDLWRSTLMANAARDPLWRAVLSAEVAATPSRRAAIEEKCLRCHAPMAERVGLDEHGSDSFLHMLECDCELGALARDGVSCTVCHGMTPEGLGQPRSFSAGFELDEERRLFGPHEAPFAMPMRRRTGFTPAHGEHLLDAGVCGSCHTLETDALHPDGSSAGARLLEQAPYLEWRNSDYRDEVGARGPLAATCQACHAPTRDEDGDAIRTRIARNPGGRDFPPTRPREPYGRHLFVGGNTLVPALLRDHGPELAARASPSSFQATLDAARERLGRAARVTIEDVRQTSGSLSFAVRVENLAGHKLPTGHPTRRAWLRVVVRDADGAVLFASGATDAAGRIVGGDGRPLASELAGGPLEPHRDVVRSADEVAAYRAVMADAGGVATHTLLHGASWLIDDRLLPRGWSAQGPDAQRTAPVGVWGDVAGDEDFAPGEDRVRFVLPLRTGAAVTVEAALLHQTLSARWAAELLRLDTPEVDAFRTLYEEADRSPTVLASARHGR